MNHKSLGREFDRKFVYIKAVDGRALPDDILAGAEDMGRMYAVHDSSGAQLAVVANRNMAYQLALDNELVPVNVH